MWYIRVTYKDKATNNTYTRDIEYDGEKETNKFLHQYLVDAEKLANSDKRENEEIVTYNLINKEFKYILISVVNSDSTSIYTQFFYTLEDAQSQMAIEVADTGNCDTIEQLEEKYLKDGDFGITDFTAWSNCEFDSNYHWKIVKINN